MKKYLPLYFYLALITISNATKAFELSEIPENRIIAHLTSWSAHVVQRFKQEGLASASINSNARPIKKETYRNIVHSQFQIATPLTEKMLSEYCLYRFELNYLKLADDMPSRNPNFHLLKLGVSGRHILSPTFILGGYLLIDKFLWLNPSSEPAHLLNTGVECLWPRRGVALMIDSICNPINLLGEIDKRFYKTSIKLSFLKPNTLDAFVGISLTKCPDYPSEMLARVGAKIVAPTSVWNLNKLLMIGGALTYAKRHDQALIAIENVGLALSLEFNLLARHKNNSFKDYLRMPIDRFVATPWHPDQIIYHKPPSRPSSPRYRSYDTTLPPSEINLVTDKKENDQEKPGEQFTNAWFSSMPSSPGSESTATTMKPVHPNPTPSSMDLGAQYQAQEPSK